MSSRTPRKQRADGARSRATILRAAANLATIEGLEGITIGSLAEHIGMSKSGLYAHFGSKEELQLATIATAAEILDAEVLTPAAAIEDPLEHLRSLCHTFLDYVERRVFPGGCFFVTVEVEFAAYPGAVRETIQAFARGWIERLEGLLREAGVADAEAVAFELNAFMLLGNTGFVLHDDPVYLQRARAAIDQRLLKLRA